MRDQIIYFFRVAFRDNAPNYQASFLSVLLIGIIANLAALLHRNGAVAPYEMAIPP
jgi:hypothetical protein